MSLSRRQVMAVGMAALLRPDRSLADANTDAFDLLSTEGRYAPLLLRAIGGQDDFARSMRGQWGALVGDEGLAFQDFAPFPFPAADLSQALAEPALEAIRAAAIGRRVVILNEAHIASRHRQFLSQLLTVLARDGFTHFAAETFANDPESARRTASLRAGAAVTQAIGYYTRDPVFAEAVRTALRLGYRLIPYEERADQRRDAGPADATANREVAQARNFLQALAMHPKARVVVNVGYNHLAETPDPSGVAWLALQIKRLSGIDPLTVDQAYPGSFVPQVKGSPLRTAVLGRFGFKTPIVVRSQTGDILGRGPWQPDMAVFHPSLPDVSGRPGWLAHDPERREARVRFPADALRGGPVIAQAQHAEEPVLSIPADQFILREDTRAARFYLRPGRYRIRLERLDGFQSLGEMEVS